MSVKNYEPILERQLAEAKAEIENLKGRLLDLFSRLQSATAENARLKDECNNFGKSVCELAEVRMSLGDEIERLKAENKKQEAEISRLNRALCDRERRLSEFEEALKQQEAQIERLRNEATDLQQQRDAGQYAKAFLEKTIQRKDEEIGKLEGELWLIGAHECSIKSLQAENKRLTSEIYRLISTRPKTAAEVLAAVRCEAAPHGWSGITAGGHRVVAAFFDDSWGRIAAVIDLGEDRVGGRYVENAWNAETGKGYRGAGCDLVPATELEVWGIDDPLPPPVPDPDCQPDAIDEPPPCVVWIDPETIQIRPGDKLFVVPSEIMRHADHDVITCDYLRIVRPRQ